MKIDVDALAQEIRRVDGSNSLGAGALAEAIAAFLDTTPANPAQGVSEALSDCLDMLARFTHSTSNDLNHVEARAVYRAGRAALAAIDTAPKPPGWPDPLESLQAEAIRNGKLDDTEIRNLFDCMERELRLHRERAVNPAQVTDAMVEAATKELLTHGEFSSIPGNNEPNARIAARAALTAAIGAGSAEKLGRFDHHPDPAIDFEIEVESLQARLIDAKARISKPGTEPEEVSAVLEDIQRAMTFRVGGDQSAVRAKQMLREIEADAVSAIGAGGQAVAGESFRKGDDSYQDGERDFKTFRITRCLNGKGEHYDQIDVHGDEKLRDRIIDLLNGYAITHPAPSGQAVAWENYNFPRTMAEAREALEGINEWLGQRQSGEATTNSEAAIFQRVHSALQNIDAFALADLSNPPAQPGWPQESSFHLEWIGAPRPPVHPNPMTGRQSFPTLESAIAFMQRQPADAQFVSLREFVTTKIDRTEEVRDKAIPAAPLPGGAK